MEFVHGICFNEYGQLVRDERTNYLNVVFYDGVLDELTLKVYRDTSFGAHTALISMHEIAQYTSLQCCAQHYVEIHAGRWVNTKEAVNFLKPWIKQIQFYYPLNILAHWYTPSPNNAQKALFFTFSLDNGGTKNDCIELDVSRGLGSIEQPSGWRDHSSHQFIA